MAEPCEDPISGQKHGTEYNECRRNRLMEQWSALSIKESGGTLFQEKMSEMTTVAHLTPCSFSTSPYQILLSLLLLTSGPSVPRTFPTADPSLHRSVSLMINIDRCYPNPMSCHTRAHLPATHGTIQYCI